MDRDVEGTQQVGPFPAEGRPQAEPVQPFLISRLTDVVPESVLRTIQTGLATQHCVPVAILEPDGEGVRYITPLDGEVNRSGFCSLLRRLEEGYRRCHECDLAAFREIMAEGPAARPRWYRCHMGLVEVAIPIVIADRVLAVFLSGQSVLEGSEEEVAANARTVGSQINGLDGGELCTQMAGLRRSSEEELNQLIATLEQPVREIATLGRDRYFVERRLRQVLLLGQLMEDLARPCRDHQELRTRLEGVLGRVNDFFRLQYSVVFSQAFSHSPELAATAFAGERTFGGALRLRCPERPGAAPGGQAFEILTEPEAIADFLDRYGSTGASHLQGAQAVLCEFGEPGERVSVTVFGPQREGHTESLLRTAGGDFLERFHFEVGMRVKAARLLLDLQQANEDKTQFLAQMTHEINAGLQTIVNECEWLEYYVEEMSGNDDPEILEPLRKILSEVFRLGARARSSLVHLRGGMPRGEYKLGKAHPLDRLVSECVEPFRTVAMARNITIRVDDSVRRLPPVPCDWDMLKLALMNLIDNAVKYSHFNRTVRIYGQADENWVSLSVEDYGMGIPPEEYERIFEPYVRGTQRDPRRFIWGTGLGLAVARDVVETHGGTIEVSSVSTAKEPITDPSRRWENHVTTFTVRLPLRRE